MVAQHMAVIFDRRATARRIDHNRIQSFSIPLCRPGANIGLCRAMAVRFVCACESRRAPYHRCLVGACHGANGAGTHRCIHRVAGAKTDPAWREIPRTFYRLLPLVHHYAVGHALAVFRAEHVRDYARRLLSQPSF